MTKQYQLLFAALFFIVLGLSLIASTGTSRGDHEALSDKSKIYSEP